jgi:hypothetical protein
MNAQGRSLENLLSVVNSGRVTVAELAARLKGETNSEAQEPPDAGGREASMELLDIRWDEFGSVVYDLWFIVAVTVILIVIARPAGWLVNRVKRV